VKTALKIIFGSVLGLVIAAAAILVMAGVPQTLVRRRHFDAVVRMANHEAVAHAAIEVIKASTNRGVIRDDRPMKLPPIIAGMKPRSVHVTPDGMTIEFHGGFDHFGLRIQDRGGFWEMTRYTERQQHSLARVRKEDSGGEPGAAPNGDPATPVGNSGVAEGRHR
jgi:hypothetical protein